MVLDTSLICFKAISAFCSELGKLFGKKYRSLKLYCRLISKTTLSHDKAIHRHIEAFKVFCVRNRQAIIDKQSNMFETDIVEYSSRVYINVKHIFEVADSDTQQVMWKHLLIISALVDPAGEAKKILRDSLKSHAENNGDGNKTVHETAFLENIITKIESHVDPTSSNPMEAVSTIMQTGIFTELVNDMNSGLNNGKLDMSKLMGMVQGMMSSMEKVGGEDATQSINMINTMMSSMVGSVNNNSNGSGIESVMSMLSGLNGKQNGPKIEEIE
jgi:hypothetical protein